MPGNQYRCTASVCDYAGNRNNDSFFDSHGNQFSIGKPVQQNYYLSLESTQKYGEDKAMGIYNFTENIGESAGPMIFGRMMGSDKFGISSIIFCCVIGVLTAIHYWISKKEKKDEKRR